MNEKIAQSTEQFFTSRVHPPGREKDKSALQNLIFHHHRLSRPHDEKSKFLSVFV
jgi:hypothetical protein